ncbi:flavodoxin family protein [Elusimicrobiota bacterium]
MKKTLIVIFLLLLILAPLISAEKSEEKMKTLIVYYSYTGNTAACADTLAKELNADIERLEDVKRPGFLKAIVLGSYAAHKGESWPIQSTKKDISSYDRIFIGAPIWWFRTAPELNTFIDQNDFSGKEVVVFVTMASSDPQKAFDAITDRVTSKGGKVTSTFSIATSGLSKEDVVIKAKEIAEKY